MYIRSVASSSSVEGARRSQAERRAATRTALLEATIDCLVKEGYANTTTRRIAERAGVTPGALQHHFASKSELICEAVRHLAGKLAQEVIARGLPAGPSLRERLEEVTDHAWELHQGPIFQAGLELLIAARTDSALRQAALELGRDVGSRNEVVTTQLFGELAQEAGFGELVSTGIAAMRGLAIVRFTGDDESVDNLWPAMRAQLIDRFLEFACESEAPW
jgi:AcrR family transcriptional regulator